MMKIAASILMLIAVPAVLAAQNAPVEAIKPPPPPSFQRSPQINDFIIGQHMREQADGMPAYLERIAIYRTCSDAALRKLAEYRIDPVDSFIYTSVRQCTRPLHDYVKLFAADPAFQANQYVSHAIMRMAQQEQMDLMRPLAAQLLASAATPVSKLPWR